MSTSLPTLNLLETKGIQANALLAVLEENFPPTNPTPQQSMEQIMFQAGQRSVVEWVYHYMDEI
jgi:hypothetical protein